MKSREALPLRKAFRYPRGVEGVNGLWTSRCSGRGGGEEGRQAGTAHQGLSQQVSKICPGKIGPHANARHARPTTCVTPQKMWILFLQFIVSRTFLLVASHCSFSPIELLFQLMDLRMRRKGQRYSRKWRLLIACCLCVLMFQASVHCGSWDLLAIHIYGAIFLATVAQWY